MKQITFEDFENLTHALITVEAAQRIAGMFEQNCAELVDVFETSTEPKAYHSPTAEGVPTFVLSPWLCNKLKLKYPSFLGRGSQHRACCEVLKKYLQTNS